MPPRRGSNGTKNEEKNDGMQVSIAVKSSQSHHGRLESEMNKVGGGPLESSSEPDMFADEKKVKEDPEENFTDNQGKTTSCPEGANSKRRVKKRKRILYEADTENDNLSSQERKTKNGGYAHTNKSKMKISEANTGNTPWNKGKNRSSADRAKIAAGVRARNRAILLERLKRLGMSEEEYVIKKREIKYLKERIRRAKAANEKHKAVDAEMKLKAAIEATTGKDETSEEEKSKDEKAKTEDEKKNAPDEVFCRDIVWTPFLFSENEQRTYDQVCPEGGPGGLICCAACCKTYSLYLSQTVKDMEAQRMSKRGKEVKEISQFLVEGRKKLERAYDVAKKKAPPLPPPPRRNPEESTRKSPASRRREPGPAEWNMTSTLDISLAGGVKAV